MSLDLEGLARAVARHGAVMRVAVAEIRGSAPREAGAAMIVDAQGFEGTIGGGALEWEALAEARRRLAGREAAAHGARVMPLGPALGQCCGGAATLAFERWDAARLAALKPQGDAPLLARPLGGVVGAPDAPAAIRGALRASRMGGGAGGATGGETGGETGTVFAPGDPPWLAEPLERGDAPLWLWGAGHVGRAVVHVFQGLPFRLTWIDIARERFPESLPDHAEAVPAADPAALVRHAPGGAAHLVMTHSHALDLELCHRILTRGDFARLGLIGSAAKSARFRARLRALGHGDAALARLECPIGLAGPEGLRGGKAPAEIAVSVAADHLQWRAARAPAREAAS